MYSAGYHPFCFATSFLEDPFKCLFSCFMLHTVVFSQMIWSGHLLFLTKCLKNILCTEKHRCIGDSLEKTGQ